MNAPTGSPLPPSASKARMEAIVRRQYGGPDVLSLQTIARPEPKPHEVRIKVHAAGINQADWFMLTGSPFVVRFVGGLTSPKDAVPGMDIAGVIDAVFGEARRAYAEYACVKPDRLSIKPEGVSFEQAASLPIAGVTALQGLRDQAGLQPGQTVLINGASGGVGTYAIQIAKALGGIVTAVCSTRNVEQAKALGATEVIDYTQADFTEGGAKYDVIFDLVANRTLAQYRALLTEGGVYVSSAGRLGWVFKAGLASIVHKQIKVLSAPVTVDDLNVLADMVVRGALAPVIKDRVGLDGVAAALARQGEGRAQGKTVVVVG